MAPRRVLLISHTSRLGGAERVLLTLARGLDRRRWDPVVAVPRDGLLLDLLGEANISTVRYRPDNWIRPDQGASLKRLEMLQSALNMEELLRVMRPDLVHTNTSVVSAGAIAAARLGVPHIWHLHESVGEGGSQYLRAFAPPEITYGLISRSAAEIIVVSEALRRNVLRWFAPEELTTIANGIEPLSTTTDREEFRGEFGIGRNDIAVTMLAPIIESKGQQVLLRAVGRMSSGRRVVVLLAGRGAPADLDLLAEEALTAGIDGRVHFLGFRRDIGDLLIASDILVVASDAETFSLATVEAMSVGIPVIATRCGGPEEIVVNRETGLLVDSGDETGLASALDELVADDQWRRELGRRGYDRQRQHFTSEQMVSSIAAVYDRAMTDTHRVDAGAVEALVADYQVRYDRERRARTSLPTRMAQTLAASFRSAVSRSRSARER